MGRKVDVRREPGDIERGRDHPNVCRKGPADELCIQKEKERDPGCGQALELGKIPIDTSVGCLRTQECGHEHNLSTECFYKLEHGVHRALYGHWKAAALGHAAVVLPE